jgi:hypothetical protein
MWRVRDELCDVVAPLVPVHKPDPRGGRPRVDDRVCFGAIMFVLFTGLAGAPSASSPIAAMTTTRTAARCATAASRR